MWPLSRIRVLAASLPRVTKTQSKNVQVIYGVLNRLPISMSLEYGPFESRVTPETVLQVLRSLRVEGKDYFDAVPSLESLFSATVLGANSVCGLGSPEDWGSWELASAGISRALRFSAQQTSVRWYNRGIEYLSEKTCPFCNPAVLVDPFCENQNKWVVFAFWEQLPKLKQDHILFLCSSTSSTVTSLAVCKDSNWTSETAGHHAKLHSSLRVHT